MAPVSYTHLDVYKRQDFRRAWSRPQLAVEVDRAVVLGKCQARGHVRYRTPFGQWMLAAKFGRRGAKDGRQFTYGARERLLKPLNRADGNFLANNGGIERAISGLQRMEQRIGICLLYTSA